MDMDTFDTSNHTMGFVGAATAGADTTMPGAPRTAVLPPMPPASTAPTDTTPRPKVEELSFGTAVTTPHERDDNAAGHGHRHRAHHTRSGVARAMRSAKAGTRARGRNPWPIVAGVLLAVLLAALVSYFFVGRWYFQDKAAPGVSLGNVSVTGQNREQLTDTVNRQIAATKVTFDANGRTAEASLKDLGVATDADKTVDALLNAKAPDTFGATIARLNPFAKSSVPLTATTNDDTAFAFATDSLVDEGERERTTGIAYDANAKRFTVKAGQDGQEPEATTVKDAVARAIADPGQVTTTQVKLITAKDPITADTAQKTADDANARLGLAINVNNGGDKTVAIPADQIAQWIGTSADATNGTLALTVDHDAIDQYLKQDSVVKALTVPMVTEEVYVRPASEGGTSIGADKTLGVDGIEVTGNGSATDTIANAIQNGQPANATVATKVTPHDTKNVEVPHDFDKPNGSKWVHVDLTNQTATAYEGTTVVKTFLIASGQYTADGSRLSETGTFYVYLKYEQQTMTGPGYSQPTPWISYYNGSEALHAVPPYLWGDHPIYVQQGIPGSHGCINMQVADGKWMYDWADVGTRVVVDGTTPSSGQPIREAGADATNYQG